MRKLNRKTLLAALVAVAILCVTAVPVWAYFTTYTKAGGSWEIETEDFDTDLREEVEDFYKHVRVENHGGSSGGVYVRARAFAPSGCQLDFVSDGHPSGEAGEEVTDGTWSIRDDGWYYYSAILLPGSASSDLDIKIGRPGAVGDGGLDFNVVVVYEAAPAAYDENGNPYADWSRRLMTA